LCALSAREGLANLFTYYLFHLFHVNIAFVLKWLVVAAGTEAEDLIRRCLSVDQCDRPSLSEVLDHPWMQRSRTVVISDEDDGASTPSQS